MDETNAQDRKKTSEGSAVDDRGAKHEPTDIEIRGILAFAIGLFVVVVVVQLLLWWLFDSFTARVARSQPPRSPMIRVDQQRLPPEPRLQGAPGHEIHPLEELKQLRNSEDAILKSYGWVDRNAGIVRIPVEQSMRLLAERGLPHRQHDTTERREQRGQAEPEASRSGQTQEER